MGVIVNKNVKKTSKSIKTSKISKTNTDNKILLTKLSSKDIDNMRCSAYQYVL